MLKTKSTTKLILRFYLLILGIILTANYYNFVSIPQDVNSWGPILIFVGLLVAVRHPWLVFEVSSSLVNYMDTALYGKREIEPDGSYAVQDGVFSFVTNFSIRSLSSFVR